MFQTRRISNEQTIFVYSDRMRGFELRVIMKLAKREKIILKDKNRIELKKLNNRIRFT